MSMERFLPPPAARRFAAAIALLGVVTPTLAGANAPRWEDSWQFDVLLDDKPIGTHEFVLRSTTDGQQVLIDASFDVRILRIPVYSYRHQNTELWSDGCLTRLDSRTDDNGERLSVTARRKDGAVVVESDSGSRTVADRCVMSFAYWNPQFVRQKALLNAQTGEMVPVEIRPVDATPTFDGIDPQALDAYLVTSTDDSIHIEIAYTRNDGRWIYLESRLDNGRTLRYLPRGFGESAPAGRGSET